MYAYLLIRVAAIEVDDVSALIWNQPGITGMEEMPTDGTPWFGVDPEFRWVESGTALAGRFAEYLGAEQFRGEDQILLRVCVSVATRVEWEDWLTRFRQAHPQLEIRGQGMLPDEDYVAAYRRQVHGSVIGRRLWVGPPWEPAPRDRLSVVIDPGSAFGTGEHPTTRLCVAAIEELLEEEKILPRQVFDIGTGSGVLSLVVARLCACGAPAIWLSDYDPLCEANARRNFQINQIAFPAATSFWGETARLEHIDRRDTQFDLVLSNLYLNALVEIARPVAEMTNPHGYWIVSGLLGNDQLGAFCDAADAAGWQTMIVRDARDEECTWFMVMLRRLASSQGEAVGG